MPEAECRQCGACCRTFHVYASLTDARREPRIRWESLPVEPWMQTSERSYRLFPLPFHEGCCFLTADNRCAIYATRPAVCRDFAPDGPQCVEARKASEKRPRA